MTDHAPPNDPSAEGAAAPSKPRTIFFRVLLGFAIVVGLAVVGLALAGTLLYRAATAPLPEYDALLAKSLEAEASGELDRQRQELESQVAALYSDAQAADRWQTVITAEQLNAWLATQLAIDFPRLEASGIYEPRVMLNDGVATIACRAQLRGVAGVVALSVAPFMATDGSVGVEVQGVRVGNLALPASVLIEKLDEGLQDADYSTDGRVRRTENEGRPVLLFDFESLTSTADQIRSIDAVEIREGELYVAGRTEANPTAD